METSGVTTRWKHAMCIVHSNYSVALYEEHRLWRVWAKWHGRESHKCLVTRLATMHGVLHTTSLHVQPTHWCKCDKTITVAQSAHVVENGGNNIIYSTLGFSTFENSALVHVYHPSPPSQSKLATTSAPWFSYHFHSFASNLIACQSMIISFLFLHHAFFITTQIQWCQCGVHFQHLAHCFCPFIPNIIVCQSVIISSFFLSLACFLPHHSSSMMSMWCSLSASRSLLLLLRPP